MRRSVPLLLVLTIATLSAGDVETAEPVAEAKEKPILVVDPGGHMLPVQRLLFTPDGKELISVSGDDTIRIRDVATGETIRVLRLPADSGEHAHAHALALAADGRLLAVSRNSPAEKRFWIYLIALAENRVVRTLKGHTDEIPSVAFSPDGTLLASCSLDRTVRLWKVATGEAQAILRGHKRLTYGVAFSPDGSKLASTSINQILIWSVATGQSERILNGPPAGGRHVEWTPDGKTLVSSAEGSAGPLHVWNADGTPRRTIDFKHHKSCWVFTPDAQVVLAANGQGEGCALVDLASGKVGRRFRVPQAVTSLALSPDGQLAASGAEFGEGLCVWKTTDGSLVHRLEGKGWQTVSVAWSRDGKAIAWSDHTAGVKLTRSFHLEEMRFGGKPDDTYRRAQVQLGGLTLEQVKNSTTVKRGKELLSSWKEIGVVKRHFTFLGSERFVLAAPHGLYLLETKTGKRLRTFQEPGRVKGVAPAPDDRYFVTASEHVMRVWDPNRDTPVLSLFVAGDDWIAWTPEGYYDATPGGERLMGWQVNNGPEQLATFYPAAQFRRSLYRPDVLRRLLAEGSVAKALAVAERDKKDKSPLLDISQVLPPKVAITAPAQTGLTVKEATLTVKAAAQTVGADPVTEMQLLLDGRPHEGEKNRTRSIKPQPGKVEAAWTVQLPPGSHRLSVVARTAKSSGISEAVEITYLPAQRPDLKESLHILAIGIDAYPGDLRLQCAVRDATKLKEALEKNGAPLFRTGQRRLLTNSQATKQAILAELDALKHQMKAQDVAIIFYAGHGHKDAQGEFYLLPAVFDADRLAQTAVTGSELKKKLAELPGRVLLILDACHSGAVGAKVKGSQPFTDDLTRELADDDCGVIVMCAAMGKEESIEDGEHGYFTRFLIGGLSGQADRYKGRVYFTGLDYYVERMVSEKTQDRQHPVTAKPSTIRSFALTQP